MRRKLRFCLLRTTLAAVRGFRGTELKKLGMNSDINGCCLRCVYMHWGESPFKKRTSAPKKEVI